MEALINQSRSFGAIEARAGLVGDEFRNIFVIINYITLMGIISFLGVIFNIINIIVFVKQGLSNDTVNITLTALAVADLFSVLAHLWQSLCYNIWMFGSFTTINFKHLQYITASWPSGMFGRISSWLTVLISFERCLCVVLPLHVKRIMTPRRVVYVIVFIYLAMIGLNLPVFYAVGLKRYFFPPYNTTMLGFFYRYNGVKIEQVSLSLLGTSQMISFALILIFTSVLAIKLNSKSKWRQSVSLKGQNQDSASSKDKKVSKMVIFICFIFIALLSPYWFSGVAMAIFPEYNNLGRYRNIFVSVFSVVLTLEAFCSTINIFVYYTMSSKYAATLRTLFCLGETGEKATKTSEANK